MATLPLPPKTQLAVTRRQLAFVEQLGDLGAIEEEEQEALGELLEEKLAQCAAICV